MTPEGRRCRGCRGSFARTAETTTDLKGYDWHMACADAALATCREGTGHRLLMDHARRMGLEMRAIRRGKRDGSGVM